MDLAKVETFGKFLGGSATNVAVAAARLGRSTAVITRTGDDPFGTYLHEALKEFGVDDRWVAPVAAYPTPVTFCEIFLRMTSSTSTGSLKPLTWRYTPRSWTSSPFGRPGSSGSPAPG